MDEHEQARLRIVAAAGATAAHLSAQSDHRQQQKANDALADALAAYHRMISRTSQRGDATDSTS